MARVWRQAWALVALAAPAAVYAGPDIAELDPGIVRVIAETQDGYGTGTGFIVNDTGLVGTNHHVVEGGSAFHVLVSGSRTPVEAQVLVAGREIRSLRCCARPASAVSPATLTSAPVGGGLGGLRGGLSGARR